MATRTLEDRVTMIEQELERLKQQLQAGKLQDTEPRWKQIIGVFKDDPLFDEAERSGREWRELQRMEDDDTETMEFGWVSLLKAPHGRADILLPSPAGRAIMR